MSLPLDYASPVATPPNPRLRTIIRLSLILLAIAGAIFAVLLVVMWLAFHQMDQVTLTIDNQTGKPIDTAQITDGNGVAILTLDAIPPGGTASASVHFGNDEGGESDLIITQSGRTSRQGLWMLINTHGPYEYTATVRPAGVHLTYRVATKGSGSDDFASPTTMP